MRTMALSLVAVLALFLHGSSFAQSPLPRTLSYQGIFSDTLGSPKPDGLYSFTFALYGAQMGGTPLWSEQKTLHVTKGLFHTLLGDQVAFPPSLTFASQYWLGIRVGTEAEMSPRIALTAAAYSLHAATTDTALVAFRIADTSGGMALGDGEVKTNNIADSAVTSEKIRVPISFGAPGAAYDIHNGPPLISALVSNTTALQAFSAGGYALHAQTLGGIGVYAERVSNEAGWLIYAQGSWEKGGGVYGTANRGIVGEGTTTGVEGRALGDLVHGIGVSGTGVGHESIGVYGTCADTTSLAGKFDGDVAVSGTLTKGGGAFKIDHPLDPANKYLMHSFVESPDMKNVYDGVVTLDGQGTAEVTLPDYFQTLNRDFRYQLTCVGGYAPVYIAEEVTNNAFKIAGGKPGLKVSWQVTGIRQDAFANAHRIVPEQAKPESERGTYLYPRELGVSEKLGASFAIRARQEELRQEDKKLSVKLDAERKARQAAPTLNQMK